MATWTFSGYNNGRGAAVTFTYTAAFDPATNKTRVTITNCTAAFNTGGASGYCALTGTLTVKAAGNTASYGTLDVSQSKNGNSPTVSADVSQVIEVTHGTGTSKQITLAFSGTINSVTYFTYPNESSTVTVASATARSLSLSAGSGAEISVSRQSSPWASAGSLLNGDAIYDGDVLVIGFSAMTGYALTAQTHTVNGADFESGGSLTVSANVTVSATTALLTYTLTISADGHAAVTVTRGGETLTSGAEISHFDVLAVTVSAKAGYKVSTADINGTAISPETEVSHTVSGPVTVTVITEALSNLLLDVGGVRKRFLVLIDSGGERKNFRAIFK